MTARGPVPGPLSARPRPEPAAVREAFARRDEPGRALADAADAIARTCYDMAVRFHAGGKLIVFGNGASATDAEHIAVEFAHPVIVGKVALPALSLTDDAATLTAIAARDGFDETFAAQIRLLGRPEDIALGLSADGRCANVARGLAAARRSGLLTIALTGGYGDPPERLPAVDHLIVARSGDPCVIKEMHVTAYHIMWELVHVLAEQPDLLEVASP